MADAKQAVRAKGHTAGTLGCSGTIGGYALDPVSPIIKRICTSSFVLTGGGWCVLALALSYWIIDVKRIRWGTLFLLLSA